ncbi:hypothetical protein EV426DRAFT_676128 [Tirmania nivea]|nr:hypothetical protein EV426DRAFT_676128 [Tirmania nivea]
MNPDPTESYSRAIALHHHIWDGDDFRPLKPTEPFRPPLPPSSFTEPQLPISVAAKLLPRTEAQWILTPCGMVTQRQLARRSAFMLSSWETAVAAADENGGVLLPEGERMFAMCTPDLTEVHTLLPREVLTHDAEDSQDEERDDDSSVSSGPENRFVIVEPTAVPVLSIQPKAVSVLNTATDIQVSVVYRVQASQSGPLRRVVGRLFRSQKTAEQSLQQVLVVYGDTG